MNTAVVQTQSKKYPLTKRQKGLYYLLISDFIPKHRKLYRSLRNAKKWLVYNMRGKSVLAQDIHTLFRLYNTVQEDIVVREGLKKHLPRFVVNTNIGTQFSVEQYLKMLTYVRSSLQNLQATIKLFMKDAQDEISKPVSDGVKHPYTQIEDELYHDELKSSFGEYYRDRYAEEEYQQFTWFDAGAWIIDVDKLIEHVAIVSYYPHYHTLLADIEEQASPTARVTIGDLNMSLKDFLSFLESLNFPGHLFLPPSK